MPLTVICPACHARFQVSEKFAGKEGPCPKCKGKIKIPKLEEQVTIHAPTHSEAGAKDAKGRSVLKPISRTETKLSPVAITSIVAAVIGVLIGAFVLRKVYPDGTVPWYVLALAGTIISPAIVYAGYTFLRDDELEPFRGRELWTRVGICAAIYGALWAIYGFVPGQWRSEMWWLYITPPFFAAGAAACFATLDFEFGTGFLHYTFYAILTVTLALITGVELKTATEPTPYSDPLTIPGRGFGVPPPLPPPPPPAAPRR